MLQYVYIFLIYELRNNELNQAFIALEIAAVTQTFLGNTNLPHIAYSEKPQTMAAFKATVLTVEKVVTSLKRETL